jgi:hypothetical protein
MQAALARAVREGSGASGRTTSICVTSVISGSEPRACRARLAASRTPAKADWWASGTCTSPRTPPADPRGRTFRFTGTTYRNLIIEVENQGRTHGLRLLRPTAGFELFHAEASISVLSPSISLRNRYDTYGVDINNASVVMRVTYPVDKPSSQYPKTGGPPPAGDAAPDSTTVILGGDAQSDAWGQLRRSPGSAVLPDRQPNYVAALAA